MPILALIALLALPFLEIWVMIAAGAQFGAAWTVAALFAASAAGAVVIRLAGMRAFRDVDEAMRTGQPPRRGMLDTLMLLVGGILLAVPGFVTAAAGVVLALPLTRPALRWAFERWARRRMERMGAAVVDADFVDLSGDVGARQQRPETRVIRGTVVSDDEAGTS